MSTERANDQDGGIPDLDTTPFIEATGEAKAKYGRFNLAIVGNSGVGKSSLVNAVFGRELAKIGKGRRVTEGVEYFFDGSLGIWDVEGFEIGTEETPREALQRHLAKIAERPVTEQISVVWYCLLAASDRFLDQEVEMIRELDAAGLPVVLVVTKVDWDKHPITGQHSAPADVEAFRNELEARRVDEGIPIKEIILTSARSRNGKDAGHGLGELITSTLALSPEGDKDAFRVAQRLNLPWKREMARKTMATAAAAAAAAAAVPVPVADAVTLAPIQLGMMARIAAIYELDLKSMLSVTALAQIGAQLAGQALARSFLKLIPGAGSAINASVAAALTAAIGEAWLRLCEQVHMGKIDLANVADEWERFAPSIISVVRKLIEERAVRH